MSALRQPCPPTPRARSSARGSRSLAGAIHYLFLFLLVVVVVVVVFDANAGSVGRVGRVVDRTTTAATLLLSP